MTASTHRRTTAALALCATLLGTPALADVTLLDQSDFVAGTYRITEPGVYRLAEDVSFNPHPPGSLAEDGSTVLDAYSAGMPYHSQMGPPELGMYDPAAYGIGFFAAIAIEADGVVLDLSGHTIEQSAEHALLQRFFAVIELADQPFVPSQGPADFGGALRAAENVVIRNGTIGRSSHHGIHGNGNENVRIEHVDFVDFEVAAVALNGVENLTISHSNARNRQDVPILGTFSNARFISAYVDWLVMTGSTTTLTVQGAELGAPEIRDALRDAINDVHEDVIVDGLGFIDPSQHPAEYALFHNRHGVVDGNSYGFLVNPLGVAVGGFPSQPEVPATNIFLRDVAIRSQRAFVNEVVAIQKNGKPVIDPVGAVFMLRNAHPDTGAPVTVSSHDEATAVYVGNVLSNAQALVAKAALAGEFPPFLDTSRLNITQEVIDWIESEGTLSELAPSEDDYLCNGDTMFHVNKGVIGFKIDGARHVLLSRTTARGLENLGGAGSDLCGNYATSHPDATLEGYGGAGVRGYSFAGSRGVWALGSRALDLRARNGTVVGFDILTDSRGILIWRGAVRRLEAGSAYAPNGGPNAAPDALGVHIGPDASDVAIHATRIRRLRAFDEAEKIRDESGTADY